MSCSIPPPPRNILRSTIVSSCPRTLATPRSQGLALGTRITGSESGSISRTLERSTTNLSNPKWNSTHCHSSPRASRPPRSAIAARARRSNSTRSSSGCPLSAFKLKESTPLYSNFYHIDRLPSNEVITLEPHRWQASRTHHSLSTSS